MKKMKFLSMTLLATIVLSSCSNDDDNVPTVVNEEEVITTITATFTPVNGGAPIILKSYDADGDGPIAPVITVSDPFATGQAYHGAITLLNELETPAGNITEEVHEEGVDHQFFFQSAPSIGTFAYTDADANGRPIGLAFDYTASATAVSSNLTITLRHQPNKAAAGVANGDITNAAGETDIQILFPTVVQ